jgi:uncharacterized cupredoxin-like copper-binding protein
MRQKRLSVVAGVFGVCALALMGWVFGAATGPAAGQTARAAAAKVTTITVTAGKPSELAFTVSKTSGVATGLVTFKVTNKGKITHDFKVCTAQVLGTKAVKNTCTGKGTKMLKPGQSAILTITVKKGKYQFLCTVPGHAAGGMKGLIGVGVTVPVVKPTTTTTTKTTTTTTVPAGTCTQTARATTVSVGMIDFAFNMSTTSIPCGQVTFNTTNSGEAPHNFTVLGVGAAGVGPIINPGTSASYTVALNPGGYDTICDVPTHAALGMTGRITVTA